MADPDTERDKRAALQVKLEIAELYIKELEKVDERREQAESERDVLQAKLATTERCLTGLLDKLDIILPKVHAIIAFTSIRTGCDAYDGPNISEDMAESRRVLADKGKPQ